MSQSKTQNPRKNINDFLAYQQFKNALEVNGFVPDANPKLLDFSRKIAEILYERTQNRQRRDCQHSETTINQFRNFFNEVRGLKQLIDNPSKLSVELRMLRARVSYAAGRAAKRAAGCETISEDLSVVINDCIDAIIQNGNLQTQISGFCDVFEALYAYYYYYTNVHNPQCSETT